MPDQKQIIGMFDAISHRYDFLNSFLSLGIHHLWKKKAVQKLAPISGGHYLDMCCGTGDLAQRIQKTVQAQAHVTGMDLSEKMLAIAHHKNPHIQYIQASATEIPFPDNSLDGIIIGFGIRNVVQRSKAFEEFYRCLKPQGKLIILEFSQPQNMILNQLYQFYFKKILPWIGQHFSKHAQAYQYLPDSVHEFPFGEKFLLEWQPAGFKELKCFPVSLGIATIYEGKK